MKTIRSKYQIQEQRIIIRKTIKASGKNIDKNGLCRVYIQIISFFPDGRRSDRLIPTIIKINPKHWDSKKWDGTITKKEPDYEYKNAKIEDIFYMYAMQLQKRELGTYSPDFMPEDLPTIDDMFPKVVKGLTGYLEDYIKLREKTNGYNTVKSFKSLKTRLENYEQDNNIKLTFESITLTFSDEFYAWMLKKEYEQSTIGKTYTLLITFLSHYYDRQDELNLKISDKFKNRRFRRGDTKASNDAHPLTYDEFTTLVNHKFDNQHMEITRKRFLLQCGTGMRWSDLFAITPELIINDNIIYTPQKTIHKKDNKAIVPLNDISRSVLQEVDYDSRRLYVSNQKYNDSLRDMFKALNTHYKKNIFDIYTSHDARDTFISLMIMEGADIPSIMKMVGQSSWIEMRKYTQLEEKHINGEMKKAKIFTK